MTRSASIWLVIRREREWPAFRSASDETCLVSEANGGDSVLEGIDSAVVGSD